MYDGRLILKCLKSLKYWPRVAKVMVAKLMARKTVLIRADGVVLEGGTRNGQGLWCLVSGLDYEDQLPIWLEALQPGDVVLDVGANIGAYAIRSAQRVGSQGRVVAFEPLPANITRLKRNISYNEATNICVVDVAVGEREGYVTLYEGGRESSASLCRGTAGLSHEVRATTIDSMVEELQLSRIEWVKMDIEGAEPFALTGMQRTLARYKPKLLFENGEAGKDSIALLQAHGYVVGQYDSNMTWHSTEEGANLFARPSCDL